MLIFSTFFSKRWILNRSCFKLEGGADEVTSAMTKPAQKHQLLTLRINLLHPQGEPLQLPGKLLKWLVSYGRFIVIVVDIIVLACFLIRFQLDSNLAKINREINAEIEDIKSHQTDETLIKNTQQRLSLVQQTYATTPDWRDTFNRMIAKTPVTVRFTRVNFDHAQNSKTLKFKVTAVTNSPDTIGYFLKTLKQADATAGGKADFTNINLSGISYDQGQITFNVDGATVK